MTKDIYVVIGGVIGLLIGVMLMNGYNLVIGHPRVAAEARLGYVLTAERATLETKLALEEKRRIAAERISANHANALAKATKQNQADMARLEQENADYEARLNEAGRRCELDADDINWLRKS